MCRPVGQMSSIKIGPELGRSSLGGPTASAREVGKQRDGPISGVYIDASIVYSSAETGKVLIFAHKTNFLNVLSTANKQA